MLQLLKAQKPFAASASLLSIIWEPEILSTCIVMLYIGRQRKTVIVYSLSTAYIVSSLYLPLKSHHHICSICSLATQLKLGSFKKISKL
jgi:hypothetical protein